MARWAWYHIILQGVHLDSGFVEFVTGHIFFMTKVVAFHVSSAHMLCFLGHDRNIAKNSAFIEHCKDARLREWSGTSCTRSLTTIILVIRVFHLREDFVIAFVWVSVGSRFAAIPKNSAVL
jgi:hypothetical protein